MNRKKILIIDNFEQETVELRKSLITFGYEVRIVQKGSEVEAYFNEFLPELMVIETRLADTNLANLIQYVRAKAEHKPIPIIATGNPRTVEERLDVLSREVDDFIYKPFDLDEFMVRLDNLIREVSEAKEQQPVTGKGFSGSLAEMTLVDLLQTLEVGKKTGIISLYTHGREGKVFIVQGDVVDAQLQNLEARQALMRMFTWTEGQFTVDMNKHDTPKRLLLSTREIISEGMTRQYRWEQLRQNLPTLRTIIKPVSSNQQVTEDEDAVLAIIDGKKNMLEIIEASKFDDLKVLRLLRALFEKKMIEQSEGLGFGKGQEPHEAGRKIASDSSEHGFVTNVFAGMFHASEARGAAPSRRRIERRRGLRRSADRRSNGHDIDGKIVLNKTELIMIREKLLSGLKASS